MSKFRNNGFPSIFTYTILVSKNVTKFSGWCYLKPNYGFFLWYYFLSDLEFGMMYNHQFSR